MTGEAVDSSNKGRGYEIGENEFLLVEDRDLARARRERPPTGMTEHAEPPRRKVFQRGPPDCTSRTQT